MMLEEQEDSEMDVVEVDDDLAIKTCKYYSYKYAIITPNKYIIIRSLFPMAFNYFRKKQLVLLLSFSGLLVNA